MLNRIRRELAAHAPFTGTGAISGVGIAVLLVYAEAPRSLSSTLFWTLHPAHVLLSALVTTAMYRRHGSRRILPTVAIGYLGSIGIATLSDCVIPFLGECLLGLPNRGIHLGFVERPMAVHILAAAGIALAWFRPWTRLPHALHVLLSTWASLFHMTMAFDGRAAWGTLAAVGVFLFLAVWLPCCLSDIVFPLLFAGSKGSSRPREVEFGRLESRGEER
jgi:hypothetical protein